MCSLGFMITVFAGIKRGRDPSRHERQRVVEGDDPGHDSVGLRQRVVNGLTSSETGVCRTSSGSDTTTGPGSPEAAVLTAR